MKGRKDPNRSRTLKRLASYIGVYRLRFAAAAVCVIISAAAGVAGSVFLEILIDDYIAPLLNEAAPVFTGLFKAIAAMAGIYLIGIVASYGSGRLMIKIAQGVLKTLRDEMFAHMETLPLKYYDSHKTGDIMSRYTNDTDALRMALSQALPQLVSSAVTILFVFCAMLYLSPILSIVVVLMILVIQKTTGSIGGKSGRYFKEQQASLGALNGYIEEMIEGQRTVKVFCREDEAKQKFSELNGVLCDNATAANKYVNMMGPVINNLGNLQYVLLAIVGGAMAVSGIGGLTLGAIASFLQLSRSFSMPLGQVAQQMGAVVSAMAGAGRIFELLDEKPEQDDGYVTLVDAKYGNDGETILEADTRTGIWAWKHPHRDGSITYTRLTGDVRMVDVDFGYVEGKTVLHDVSLFAKPGQKVAFVGATGAGKTTITNLLNRFYDIGDGKIRYDGININKIKKADLRRSLGMVLQDTHLFTGTIMENIRYGNLDATDEEVLAAARLTYADSFISRLPDGYDTVLTGDGEGLSQGQRQLLSIARAAVADPPAMVLDEATSSIDTRTEILVQKGMDALMTGRTTFVIAHRLSTIRNADVIMVMDGGRIVERGNHEQLMAEGGIYYRLYTGVLEVA